MGNFGVGQDGVKAMQVAADLPRKEAVKKTSPENPESYVSRSSSDGIQGLGPQFLGHKREEGGGGRVAGKLAVLERKF